MEKLRDARLCPHCSKLCCFSCIRVSCISFYVYSGFFVINLFLFFFFFFLRDRFYSVALAGLELTLQIRLTSALQRSTCLCLPPECWD
jgi:hypothetical protein